MSRKRRIGSIKKELLQKSKEAALTAVGIFNNPNILFKSETYIVLMIIAWTYLLHAYFRSKNIEYRHVKETKSKRKKFDKTAKLRIGFFSTNPCHCLRSFLFQ